MLAKGPVQPPKTVRLIHRLREQARSHKEHYCIQSTERLPHALQWERACSRKGPYSLRKQRARTIVFASKLAPTKSITASNRRSVCHTHSSGSELARERARTASEKSVPEPSFSRASPLPQWSYCITRWRACTHTLWERACSRKGLTASTAAVVLQWTCSVVRRLPHELPGGGLRRGGRLRFRAVRRPHRLRPPAHRIHRSAPW